MPEETNGQKRDREDNDTEEENDLPVQGRKGDWRCCEIAFTLHSPKEDNVIFPFVINNALHQQGRRGQLRTLPIIHFLYQWEECPRTKKKHAQGCMKLAQRERLSTILGFFVVPIGCHPHIMTVHAKSDYLTLID
jgi:hypothetical protein